MINFAFAKYKAETVCRYCPDAAYNANVILLQ